ncbi:zinc-dependent alcohol dehydrogenase [Nocardioides acrostichi]|uniref:Zinc-binding dehydrogenase n=1 Tax=Nocardioides acrostichi TaxID=2784339 RepID=A0A930UZQ2_9ACTN|nr:zinc-binding dehydrogenase [Nocardioides acrostichi]MBF4162717.1 zinc-binding dehydrogenase [Nocardioides acrostichi]
MNRSRAVLLTEHGEVPRVVERAVPRPRTGEVCIAMRACGICGSDLHIIDGSTVPAYLPITPGHEAAGIVVALGERVTGVQVGDRVTVNPMISCASCRPCLTGRPNLCTAITILGVSTDGAHADHFVVPAANVVPLPDAVGFALGAIAADAIATPWHAISRAGVTPGDTAAVFGLGGLGLHAAMLLRQVHGLRVIGVDASDAALERAASFGIEEVVDARQGRAADAVAALTGGGVDVAFEFVGAVAVVEQAVRSLAFGGRCVVVGVGPDRLRLTVRQETLVARGQAVIGSHGYLTSDVEQILSLLADGALEVTGSISHTVGLEDYADGLAALRDPSASAIRVVVTGGG